MNKTLKTIKSIAFGIVYRIISVIGPFIVRTITIHQLGLQYAGLNNVFGSVLSILSIAELGFSNAVAFHMYKPFENKNYALINQLLAYFKKIYFIVGCIVLVLGLSLLPFISYFVGESYPNDVNLYMLYILYLINLVGGYFGVGYKTSLFQADQRNDVISLIYTVSNILLYTTQCLLILFLKNYTLTIVAFAFIVVPQNFLIYYFCNRIYPQVSPVGNLDSSVKADIKRKVSSLFGHKLGATMMVSIDNIIISSFFGLIVVSKYSNYYYFVNTMILFSNIIIQSLLAGIGNYLLTKKDDEKYKMFIILSSIWLWIVGCLTTYFICLVQDFMTLWLGSDNLLSNQIIILMGVYYYFWQFRVMGLTFKDAAGLWEADKYKPYLGMLINLFLSILLVVITHSLASILIPTILVMIFLYFPIETKVLYTYLFKKSNKLYLKMIFEFLCITIIIALLSYQICNFINTVSSIFMRILIKFMICTILANVLYLILLKKYKVLRYVKNRFINKMQYYVH